MENEIRIEDGVMYVNNRMFDPVKGKFLEGDIIAETTEADEMLNQKIGFLNERVARLEDQVRDLAVLLDHLSTATRALAEQTVRHLTPPKVEEEKVELKPTTLFGVPIMFDPTKDMYWGPNVGWVCTWQPKAQTFLYSNERVGVDIESELGLNHGTLRSLVNDFAAGKYKTRLPFNDGGTYKTTTVRMRHFGGNWMTDRV